RSSATAPTATGRPTTSRRATGPSSSGAGSGLDGPGSSLAARGRPVPRAADGRAVGQGAARHHHGAVVQVVAQPAVEGEAVGVGPEGDGRALRVEVVDEAAEGRARLQGRLGGLAALLPDGLDLVTDQPGAEADARGGDGAPAVEQGALALRHPAQPEG